MLSQRIVNFSSFYGALMRHALVLCLSLLASLLPGAVSASPTAIIDNRLPPPENHFYYSLRTSTDHIRGELRQHKSFYITLNGKRIQPQLEVSVYEYLTRTDQSSIVTLIVPDDHFYQLMKIDRNQHLRSKLGLLEK